MTSQPDPVAAAVAADMLEDAWAAAKSAFRAALALLPEQERDHTEAYLGQVFDGSRIFHGGSVSTLIGEMATLLREGPEPEEWEEPRATSGTWGEALGIDEGPAFFAETPDPYETALGDIIDSGTESYDAR